MIVTGTMIHLSIGSLIWLFLDGLGIIDNTFDPRRAPSTMVTATLFMIVGWPVFIFIWLKGMRSIR